MVPSFQVGAKAAAVFCLVLVAVWTCGLEDLADVKTEMENLVGLEHSLAEDASRRRLLSSLDKGLLDAAYSGNVKWAKALLQQGANVNGVNIVKRKESEVSKGSETLVSKAFPLYKAVYFNHMEMVKLLLDNGANTEVHQDALHFYTPFMKAVVDGHFEMAKLLLGKGANVDAKNGNGDNQLHLAIESNDVERAKFLLANGAKVEAKNGLGETPLVCAVGARKGDGEMAKLLLAKGANVEAVEPSDNYTPLMRAILKGAVETANLLLAKGAKVDVKDNHGNTPLHLAATTGEVGIAKLLLAKGAKVEARNDEGRTPLHWAATFGNFGVAKLLLANGAKVETKDNDGKTPLDKAKAKPHWICHHCKEVVKLLEGSNVQAQDRDLVDNRAKVPDHMPWLIYAYAAAGIAAGVFLVCVVVKASDKVQNFHLLPS